MPGKRIAVLGLVAALAAGGGCAAPPALNGQYPADFALLFQADQPERRAYLVEPDRWLRASRGPGASIDRLAPRTRRLTADQMERLHRLASSTPRARVRGGRYRIEAVGTDPAIAAFERYLASLAGWERVASDAAE